MNLPYTKLVATYRVMEINPKLSGKLFSERAYIRKKGGEIRPTEAYRPYRIVDQTKQTAQLGKKK